MPTVGGGAQIGSSSQITDNIILDADVNSAAGIAWGKLSKVGSRISDLASHDINDTDTTLSVPKGGTGKVSLTVGALLAGNGSGVPTEVAPSAAGKVLVDNGVGSPPSFQTITNSIPQQILGIYTGTSAASANCRIGADAASSVMIVQDASGTKLIRFAKDTMTGQWRMTHSVTDNNSGSGQPFILGSFVYKAYFGGSQLLKRYDLATLANETAMTYSGGTPNGNCGFADASFIYVFHSAGVFKKFSISGTTATYIADVTYTSAGAVIACCTDNTYAYLVVDPSAGAFTINKYPIAGGALTSATTFNNYNDNMPGFSPNSIYIPQAGVLGYGFCYANKDSATQKGNDIIINAMTLP